MSEETIKDILKLKLKIMDTFTEKLPEAVREDVKKLERDMVSALNEVTQEYLDMKPKEEHGDELEKVIID